jgi:hypothetical protein
MVHITVVLQVTLRTCYMTELHPCPAYNTVTFGISAHSVLNTQAYYAVAQAGAAQHCTTINTIVLSSSNAFCGVVRSCELTRIMSRCCCYASGHSTLQE